MERKHSASVRISGKQSSPIRIAKAENGFEVFQDRLHLNQLVNLQFTLNGFNFEIGKVSFSPDTFRN